MALEDGGVTYFIDPNFEVRDGVAVTYARMGRRRVARLSNPSMGIAVLEDYNGNNEVDVGDAWIASELGAPSAAHLRGSARRILGDAGESQVFLHDDHLGNLVLSTDAEGAVRGRRAFYPSGEVRSADGYVDIHGFTGQRQAGVADLTLFKFRQLDNTTARWTSADPLFAVIDAPLLAKLGESTTGYAYVAGAFDVAVDPTGLARHAPAPVRHAPAPVHHAPAPVQHAPAPVQHVAPPVTIAGMSVGGDFSSAPPAPPPEPGPAYTMSFQVFGTGLSIEYSNQQTVASLTAALPPAFASVQVGVRRAPEGRTYFGAAEGGVFALGRARAEAGLDTTREVDDGVSSLALHA